MPPDLLAEGGDPNTVAEDVSSMPEPPTEAAAEIKPEDVMEDVSELNPADVMEDVSELTPPAAGNDSQAGIGAMTDPMGDPAQGTGPTMPGPIVNYTDWKAGIQEEHNASWDRYATKALTVLNVPKVGVTTYVYAITEGRKQGLDGMPLQYFAANEAAKAMKDWDNIDNPATRDVLFNAAMQIGIPSQFTKSAMPMSAGVADIAADIPAFALAETAIKEIVARPTSAMLKRLKESKEAELAASLAHPGAKQQILGQTLGRNLEKVSEKEMALMIDKGEDFIGIGSHDFPSITSDFSSAVGDLRDRVIDASAPAKAILRQSTKTVNTDQLREALYEAVKDSEVTYGATSDAMNKAITTALSDIRDYETMVNAVHTQGIDPTSFRILKAQGLVEELNPAIKYSVEMPVADVRDRVAAIRKSINFENLMLGGEAPQSIFNWKLSKALDERVKQEVPEYATAMLPIAKDMSTLDTLVSRIPAIRRDKLSVEEALGNKLSRYFKNPDSYTKEIEAIKALDSHIGTKIASRGELRALKEKIDSLPYQKASPAKGITSKLGNLGKTAVATGLNVLAPGSGTATKAVWDLASGNTAQTIRRVKDLHGDQAAISTLETIIKSRDLLKDVTVTGIGDNLSLPAALGKKLWTATKISAGSQIVKQVYGSITGGPETYTTGGDIVLNSYEEVMPIEKAINNDQTLRPVEKMEVIKTLRREFMDTGKVQIRYMDPLTDKSRADREQEALKESLIRDRLKREEATRVNDYLRNVPNTVPMREAPDVMPQSLEVLPSEPGSNSFDLRPGEITSAPTGTTSIPLEQAKKDLGDLNKAFDLMPTGTKLNESGLELPEGVDYEVVKRAVKLGNKPYPNFQSKPEDIIHNPAVGGSK